MKQSIYILPFISFIHQIIVIQSLDQNDVRRLLSDVRAPTAITEEERKNIQKNQKYADFYPNLWVDDYNNYDLTSPAFTSLDQITFKPETIGIDLHNNLNILSNIENEQIALPKKLEELLLQNINLDWQQLIALNLRYSTPELLFLNLDSNPRLISNITSDQFIQLRFPLTLYSLTINLEVLDVFVRRYEQEMDNIFPKLKHMIICFHKEEKEIAEKRIEEIKQIAYQFFTRPYMHVHSSN